MIEYINIYSEDYYKLSNKEKKENAYCIKYHKDNKEWKINGSYHREDGPAIIFNGNYYWYLNDERYLFEEWLEKTPILDEEKVFLRLKYS